jgi:hypothetical protein
MASKAAFRPFPESSRSWQARKCFFVIAVIAVIWLYYFKDIPTDAKLCYRYRTAWRSHDFLQSPGAFAAAFMILYTSFLLAPIAFDFLTKKRVRLLTTSIAIGLFALPVLQVSVIAPKRGAVLPCGYPSKKHAARFPSDALLGPIREASWQS